MTKKLSNLFLSLIVAAGLITFYQFGLTVEAIGTPVKIIKINPVIISVKQGKPIALPKTVAAITSKGTTNVAVLWKNTKIDTNKSTKIKIIGIVKDYPKNVELTINVEKYITTIDNLNITQKQNESYSLPQTINAQLSDGNSVDSIITWNAASADTSKAGKFTYTGSVKGYGKKVTLTLNVEKYITSIENLSQTIKQNENYQLPQSIKVKMSDGSEENKNIVWNQKLDTTIVGKFIIDGNVEDYNNKVNFEANIISYLNTVQNIDTTVVQEDNYVFPTTVKGKMSDGQEVDVPVKWNSELLDTTQVGKYTFIGSIEGFNQNPLLSVTVKSNKLTVNEISAFRNSVVSIVTYDSHGNIDGTGSGFVVSADGVIVTCYHVLDGDQGCSIVLENGKKYELDSILSADKDKDIMVLKLKDGKDMPFIKLGDSDKIQVGDEVVAIGNPLGFQNTVSSGNVSGLNRKIDVKLGNSIQFTAGVTFGSSGGALFNMKGEVIGMTNAGMNSTGNLNFAIPSNIIVPFLSGGTPKSLLEINPITDDENYELQLEKTFSDTDINGIKVNFNDIYISKDKDGIYVDIFYDNEYSDSFNTNIYSTPDNSQARLIYEQLVRKIYNDVKNHYQNQSINLYINGNKTFTDKPNESNYDKVTYDSSTGKWIAYILYAESGDGKTGYVCFWRPRK